MANNDLVLDLSGIDFSELADAHEESSETPIPPGRYLAAITKFETKHNEDTSSFGFVWTLAVNSDNENFEDGWNARAKTVPVTYYTYLGKKINGKMSYRNNDGSAGKPGFSVVNMLKALDQAPGVIDPKLFLGRQIIVNLGAEPDFRQTSQGIPAEDADKVLKVAGTYKYIFEGEIAPRLPGFGALENSEAPAPRSKRDADDDAFFGKIGSDDSDE